MESVAALPRLSQASPVVEATSAVKPSRLAVVMVALVVLVSARANALFSSDASLVVAFGIAAVVFWYKRCTLDRGLIGLAAVYGLFLLGYLALFGHINMSAHVRLVVALGLGYCSFKLAGDDFFAAYHKVVVWLAAVSLPLFALQLIVPGVLYPINHILHDIFPFMEKFKGTAGYSNSIIFTFNQPIHPTRNCGFMWEPGAMAAVCLIAIMINLAMYRFRVNRPLLILFAAVLSTVSTMGYSVMMVVLLYWLINTRPAFVVLGLPLLIGAALAMSQLDFMLAKVEEQLEEKSATSVKEQYRLFKLGIKSKSLGRFGSMEVDFADFLKNPVIGVGFEYEQRTQGRYLVLEKTNALSDYLVKFGAVGLLFFWINLGLSFAQLRRYGPVKAVYMFPVVITFLAFSNPVLFTPLFLGFQFYYIRTSQQ